MKFTDEYYKNVPKTFDKNIKWRRYIAARGRIDPAQAENLWICCSRDIWFYINTFVFTFDPRRRVSAIPFISYPYQDEAITHLLHAIEDGRDCLVEKSRDMGASWIILLVYEWYWKFHKDKSFLIGSRKEDLVDKRGDPDSLFWKIDFIQKNQPGWLIPSYTRTQLHFYNDDNGSTIDGESTNANFGRGGRRTSIMLDEFASVENGHQILAATSDNTNCRLFNSTPKGVGNAFFDLSQKESMLKLRLHWTQHPDKARGLYKDPESGKLRSPWYDRECERRARPMEIAQELDIDYLGSDYQFFDPEIIELHKKTYCRPACMIGDIDFDRATAEHPQLHLVEGGPLALWINLEAHSMMPPKDRKYIIGADIATGTGASNSVLSIADKRSGEKVAEYVHRKIPPDQFARVAVALCRFFAGRSEFSEGDDVGAFLIWEANGPGRTFGDAVIELGYRNIFYSQNERRINKDSTETPGWWATNENKDALLRQYRAALTDETFINRSWHAVNECNSYVYAPNGVPTHARSQSEIDPSGAKANHGDRVIADALCWRGVKENRDGIPKPAAKTAKVGSFAYRRDEHRREMAANKYW